MSGLSRGGHVDGSDVSNDVGFIVVDVLGHSFDGGKSGCPLWSSVLVAGLVGLSIGPNHRSPISLTGFAVSLEVVELLAVSALDVGFVSGRS